MKSNILFIVIDGLTLEKFYSKEKTSKTPNIDSLIKKGTFFTQTIAPGTVTIPSMSGIFTAMHPYECLVLDQTILRFNPELKNFPKFFSENNFHTISTIPESLSHTGLNKLFTETHQYTYPSTLFDGLGEKILKIISNLKESWFYYIHLSDLHNDIDFQTLEELKKFDSNLYGDNDIEKMISAMDFWLGKIFDKIDFEKTLVILTADHGHESLAYNQNMKKFSSNYNYQPYKTGKLARLGHKVIEKFPTEFNPVRKTLSSAYKEKKIKSEKQSINPIISKIENSNLKNYEKRILKNNITHTSHVYDERLLVPLLFAGPNIPSGKKILKQVQSIDIFPTICELFDLRFINKSSRGKSLLPLDDTIEEFPSLLDSIQNSTLSLSSNVIGIRTSKFKYFRDRNDSTKNIHLFDLELDPHEENNIHSSNENIVTEMEKFLQKINPSNDFTIKNSNELSESEIDDVENLLKKLGYVK